ncbi:hypothetical protein RI129_002982 [Pyrocoelia pectoralis]|uniref:Regulatory protein zeste n=1 Tax=Pyrocoelia pectoralis TaxID=417401 RepID=A0AAN7VH02_9COLE
MEGKKRCPNFTSDDKVKLIQLVESQKDVVLNKKTDGVTNKAKEEAWLRITANFNATSNTIRPTDSFKKMWNTLKSTAKTYRAKQRICVTATGGGPADLKCDPILEEVLRFLGRGGVGLSCVNDSDNIIAEHEMQPQQPVDILYEVEVLPSTSSKNEEVHSMDCSAPSIQEESAADVLPRSYKSRRRPRLVEKGSRLEVAKIKAIEEDNARAAEMHQLKKHKIEQEIEIRDIILQKIKNNESVDPSWIPLLK